MVGDSAATPRLATTALRRFKAKSQSRRGLEHDLVVNQDGRVLSCTCPRFTYKHDCRHVRELAAFLKNYRESRP